MSRVVGLLPKPPYLLFLSPTKIRKFPNRNIRLLSRVFTTAGGKQNPPAISRELTASFSLETTPVFTNNMIYNNQWFIAIGKKK